MKKFAKVMGIISLVALILGVACIAIGSIGGGTGLLGTMARNGDLAFGPEDLNIVEIQKKFTVEYEVDGDMEFDEDFEIITAGSFIMDTEGQVVKNLVVSIGGGDVDILKGDKGYWEVAIDGVGRFQSYVKNETLYVIGAKEGLNADLGDIVIYAPQDVRALSKAVISLGAGDMDIDYLAADRMEVSVGAGALEAKEVKTGDLEMSVGAGEILVHGGLVGDAEVAVGMGAIELSAEITGDIDGSVSMGELIVCVEGSAEEDHNYDVSCGAGELIVGGRSYSGVGASAEIDNDADTTYDLSCALGSIRVRFK